MHAAMMALLALIGSGGIGIGQRSRAMASCRQLRRRCAVSDGVGDRGHSE